MSGCAVIQLAVARHANSIDPPAGELASWPAGKLADWSNYPYLVFNACFCARLLGRVTCRLIDQDLDIRGTG